MPQPPLIPDYELLRLIGRGAYGEVWLARGVTGVYRAVKLVWRDRFPEAGPYEREFHGLKEFAAISLTESRQLALLHVGRDPAAAYFYYVMELADDVTTGRDIDPANYTPHTLKEMRVRRGRLPAGECVTLGVELARALSGLHVRGLVHRDIKPSNVIIVGGAPKLADIGLVTEASAALTFVGTEGFVPPEGPGAPGADVFALGKLLYELATGLDRHDYPRLPPELHAWPDRKEVLELNEVLIRACEPHPDQRHIDAAALLDDLLLLQAGKSVRQLRKAERRLARALRIAALFGLIAGVAGLGAYLERQRANQEMAGRLAAEAERDALARRSIYSAALTQAQRALEKDDFGRARKFLDEVVPRPGEPDLREFEWHALRHEAAGDPAAVLLKSGPPGQRVAFSPDGSLLVAQNADQEAVVWDRASHREVRRISGVLQLAGFSADGRWLLGVDKQYALRRWRLTDGQPDPAAGNSQDWVVGRLGEDRWLTLVIARGTRPFQLRVWDFAGSRELWRGPVPHTAEPDEEETGAFLHATVSPDGRSCALALLHGRGNTARWRILVLDLPALTVRWDRLYDHRSTALSFGRTADELACAWGDTSEVGLLDLGTGAWRWRTKLPVTQLRLVAHDGRDRIAAGGRNSLLTFLDLDSGQTVATHRGQESDIVGVAFRPDGREAISTGNGGDVRLWSLDDRAPAATLAGFWSPASGGRSLCLSPDGGWLAATAARDVVRLVETGRNARQVDLPGVNTPIAFTPGRDALWLLSTDGHLVSRALAEPAADAVKLELPIRAFIASASPDTRWIVCADRDASVAVIDTQRRQVSTVIKTGHRYPWWAVVSPDGTRIATGGVDAMVRVWSASDGRLLAEWKPVGEAVNAAFSPDGRLLALAKNTGMLEVRDLNRGATAATVVTSSGNLQAIAFDPVAPRLFLGGRDGTLHVVDTDHWREITQLKATLGGQPGSLVRNAISADGKTLAGYTESGVIRLWRKEPVP